MDDQDPRGEPGEPARVALQRPREQEEERDEELEHGEERADPEPAAVRAEDVPGHLLRDVRDPDEHELRERDVGPERHEREQELPERVEVLEVHVRAELGRVVAGRGRGDDRDREGGHEAAGEPVDAEDRREEARVERHHPVERREGHGEREERQRPRAEAPLPAGQRQPALPVLPHRPGAEQRGRRRSRPRSRGPPAPTKNGTLRYGCLCSTRWRSSPSSASRSTHGKRRRIPSDAAGGTGRRRSGATRGPPRGSAGARPATSRSPRGTRRA